MGLRIEDIELSAVCVEEFMVAVREDRTELLLLFMERRVSARSKTFPLKIEPNEAL